MLKVEFHCHTCYSKDSLVQPADLVERCYNKGIDLVIITDHNATAGALEAQSIDPQRVIIGEEVMTTQGELLAVFVKERLPSGLDPMAAISWLRDQGAFISVSHPFDNTRSGSWQPEDLLAITPYIDAIEVFNSRCMTDKANQLAQKFASEHKLAGTVGSDAHTLRELGRAVMILPEFYDADSLRLVLPLARTQTHLSSPFIHFTSRWAVWRKEIRSNR
jgi:predicted metal-dependent phosphoesterase TrpH